MNLLLFRWGVGVALMIGLLGSSMADAGEPKRWAILIGIDNYFDLVPLTSSSKDAIQFGEILQERCGFNPKNVSVVVDQPKKFNRKAMLDLRYQSLRSRIENFINAAQQEQVQTLVVYYSGHGCALLEPEGQHAADLLLPAIDASEDDGALINAMSKNELQGLLARADIPEKLLILDCCHAAEPDQIPLAGKAIHLSSIKRQPGKAKNENASAAKKINTDSSFVVLAGSAFHQVAGEQVFTKHLVDGLSVIGNTANDTDSSRQIEIDELFSHVRTSMSAGGGQTPSMKVISGKPDSISLAPAIVQLDPERIARVYILTADGNRLSDANVKLVFLDSDRGEPTTLASGTTNEDGKATLNYRFGTTRERNGRFQISVTHRGQYASLITNITGFATWSSPMDLKFRLSPKARGLQPTPAKAVAPTRAKDEISILVPAPTVAAVEPTFQEVLKAVSDYVARANVIPDICSFQKHFPEYDKLIRELKRTEKLRLSGTVICFPSLATWNRDRRFRTDVIDILTARGVLNTESLESKRSFANWPEPSYATTKAAAFGFVERSDVDVCGLVEYVKGYKELIDVLEKKEKYEVLPGLTICFPSQACWDSKPEFRKKFIRVLRESHVLEK